MLNGLDPIIIFQLMKLTPAAQETLASIPLLSRLNPKTPLPPIPIYLSEKITGLYIDSESKNIDIDTKNDSSAIGDPALVTQNSIGSVLTVNLIGSSDSLALTILLALMEILLDKVNSQEYQITYMHGAFTVFGGLIHGFSIEQNPNDSRYHIKLEIAKGRAKSKAQQVGEKPDAVRLPSTGSTPPANAPTKTAPTGGSSTKIAPLS